MADKTQRILASLPRIYRAAPGRSALQAVVGAFGGELQTAEVGLAKVMTAHWVDHADRGAREIRDLARFAALYGLAPREGEGVEAFRRHLEGYVRTFLDGTVTVRGILRLTAETLGIDLATDPEHLDPWWCRKEPQTAPRRFVTRAPLVDDASTRLLGFLQHKAIGGATKRARIVGERDLSRGVDLRGARRLRLAVDGAEPVEIDCAGHRPRVTTVDEVVRHINRGLPEVLASHDGRHLVLTSRQVGLGSRIEVLPTRFVEVREYPTERRELHRTLEHGEPWPLLNPGAAETSVEVEIWPLHGAVAPAVADLGAGWCIRVLTVVRDGQALRLAAGAGGSVQASIVATDGTVHPLPDDLVRVELLDPAPTRDSEVWRRAEVGVLSLPRGRSEWRVLVCRGSRFDRARFDAAPFTPDRTGEEPWGEVGVFGVSRFAPAPDFEPPGSSAEPLEPRWGRLPSEPAMAVTLRYEHFRAGTFEVCLPADLPERFGARFGSARFGASDPEGHPEIDTGADARFENARRVVLGESPPSLAQELLKPGPIGVLQAKAAGVTVTVTRDRTTPEGP